MERDIQLKRDHEKHIIGTMINIYCKGNKHGKKVCPDCQELYEYALFRIDRCPHMETKSFCSTCKTHCYKPEMRARIKAVMRYAGPRMIWHHPVITVRHLMDTKKGNG